MIPKGHARSTKKASRVRSLSRLTLNADGPPDDVSGSKDVPAAGPLMRFSVLEALFAGHKRNIYRKKTPPIVFLSLHNG